MGEKVVKLPTFARNRMSTLRDGGWPFPIPAAPQIGTWTKVRHLYTYFTWSWLFARSAAGFVSVHLWVSVRKQH